MRDINNYAANMRLFLGEAGKYFLLLIVCILALRLWRRWGRVATAKNSAGLFLAVAFTILAVGLGYTFMRQSLSSLYSYYGTKAFRDGRLPQALNLFETADRDWRSASTLGQCGVCLLLLGEADKGRTLIAQARTMRNGKGVPFEDFYEGLYFFTKGDVNAAVPLLQASATDDTYRWSVIKIFAVMELDANRVADAAEQMKPFMQTDVTEFDQAYIVASLKVAEGKKAEAKALLDKFPTTGLSPAWQDRFERLRNQLHD